MSGLSESANGSAEAFSFRSIYRNYRKCRRNKRNSINALRFEINAESNIIKLEQQLNKKTYRPSRCILFTAQKPKVREIFASEFKDRVIHHILIEHLASIWEKVFIFDSYACRDGKGTHKAVIRLQAVMRSISKNGNVRAYYLQLDVKDFFISIDKKILFGLVSSKVKDAGMRWLAEVTIFSDPTTNYVQCGDPQLHSQIPPNKTLFGKNNERGLPIGNLTSQYFANIYLNELDQFVKHGLKAKYYFRYVDDFVILGLDPEQLAEFRDRIEVFLMDRLKLQLHPKRRKLEPVSSGIDFLGYIVRPNYILARRRVVNNLRAKIKHFKDANVKDPGALQAALASYLGHFKWGNTYRLTKSFTDEINLLTKEAEVKV
jgi:RNA-directed DNA polymerase